MFFCLFLCKIFSCAFGLMELTPLIEQSLGNLLPPGPWAPGNRTVGVGQKITKNLTYSVWDCWESLMHLHWVKFQKVIKVVFWQVNEVEKTVLTPKKHLKVSSSVFLYSGKQEKIQTNFNRTVAKSAGPWPLTPENRTVDFFVNSIRDFRCFLYNQIDQRIF